MASDCLLCGSSGNVLPTIPKIIGAFRVVLGALETRALKLEDENAFTLQKLGSQLKDATDRSRALEGEKTAAETRSDLYKKRFLDAQKAIQRLHEENVKLSSHKSQNLSPLEDMRNFPFPRPSKSRCEFLPETKELILAPDTCAPVPERPLDVITCISSDEEDFKQDSKRSLSKSPKRSPRKDESTPPKMEMDSIFVRPKFPVSTLKQKNIWPETLDHDPDETRLNIGNSMDASVNHSDVTVLDDFNAMDSIPPSPVLSGGKAKRFRSFRSMRENIPKYNESPPKEGENPSLLGSRKNFKHRTGKGTNSFNRNGVAEDSSNLQSKNTENFPCDSIPLHHLRQDATTSKTDSRNTSLDELFERTDGNLETTTMLHNATYSQPKDEYDEDETDEELDALLLAEVEEAEATYRSQENISARINNEKDAVGHSTTDRGARPVWNDSFDVLPKKVDHRNYKYEQVVRKRNERDKLEAKTCAQCEAFYSDLPEDERRKKMQKVCRHKFVHTRPSTPEYFWDVGIPNTLECRRRGYITEEADLPPEERRPKEPRLRRKKPLKPFFNKKN